MLLKLPIHVLSINTNSRYLPLCSRVLLHVVNPRLQSRSILPPVHSCLSAPIFHDFSKPLDLSQLTPASNPASFVLLHIIPTSNAQAPKQSSSQMSVKYIATAELQSQSPLKPLPPTNTMQLLNLISSPRRPPCRWYTDLIPVIR